LRSKATLRIIGDGLVPDEITRRLGCNPTHAQAKGDVIRKNGRERIAVTGMWRLKAEERDPEDLNVQIAEIFGRLNPDPNVWASLSREFRMDLFCGLFMARGHDGVSLSPEALVALGSRGVKLALDIYDANDKAALFPL
jgi:hypothetical protein